MESKRERTLRQALNAVQTIEITETHSRVERTAADYIKKTVCPNANLLEKPRDTGTGKNGTLRIATHGSDIVESLGASAPTQAGENHWLFLQMDEDGAGYFITSGGHYLYALVRHTVENLLDKDLSEFSGGKFFEVTFNRHRPGYDHFINQHARMVKYIDHDDYFANLARIGLSHAEVNGIPSPIQFETGPKGEILHRFYTYCHALDQFVSSRLNKGIYKDDHLQANLNYLKKNVYYAEKYGLTPGILCFEPRSVPDALLQRYPMLRGARVDHPIRSFQPRYNLSVAHPVAQEHYAELMRNLLLEVPSLDYITIYSNDSGAGFEYTSSLYVGRNGGGYVIREWKGDKEIAEAAALNIVRFLKILRDAGRTVNSAFRVVLRFEAFSAEIDHIFNNLDEGIDLEAGTYKAKGWDIPYKHPAYDDVPEIGLTALHNKFDADEKEHMAKLHAKGVGTEVVYTPDVLWNHEPLVGIPFPYLIYEKMRALHTQGVKNVCHMGGITPPSYVTHNINQEVVRAFQLNAFVDIGELLKEKAKQWVGTDAAESLLSLWKQSDSIYRKFPIPIWLYNGWATWYRTLIRPIIPNIEAVSEEDRAYYENFLLATAHNRTRVDFRYDVGFDLIDQQRAYTAMERMDTNVLPALDDLIGAAREVAEKTDGSDNGKHFRELYDRLRGWKSFLRTQRNISAWVAGVHGYLETDNDEKKQSYRKLLHDMVLDEIENAEQLLELWETSRTRWMYYSDVCETTFVYGANFGELVRRKIELMKGRENDEPFVDPDFQWRVPGIPWSYKNAEINLNEAL